MPFIIYSKTAGTYLAYSYGDWHKGTGRRMALWGAGSSSHGELLG